jgi:CBS domain-containing protein
LLRTFLASIAVNAGLGIWALLAGDFGQAEAKVLATSLLVSAAMLSVLVNGAPIERRVLWPLPAVVSVVAVASFGLLIVLLWVEADSAAAVKTVFSGLMVAAGGTMIGLLALLGLPRRYELFRLVDDVLIVLVVVTGLWGLWGEIDASWYGRLLGVESVLMAAATVAIPVLGRFMSDGAQPKGRLPARWPVAESALPLVGSLASRPSLSVDRTTTLREVIDQFSEHGVGFAVVGDSHSVAGVLSAADLLVAIHDGADIDGSSVADAMSTEVITVDAGASLHEASQLMTDHGVRQLVVLGDQGGVLSIIDVLAAIAGRVSPLNP